MVLTRALIADDSRIFRFLMSEVLREHGLEAIEASNGIEAFDFMLLYRPELVITDGLMPGMSGLEVIAKAHKEVPDYRPVIFIVTAVYKSRRAEAEARQQYQIAEYLEKPLEPEELLTAIGRHFPVFLGA